MDPKRGMDGPGAEGVVKTVPIIRDFALNPSCAHGPTILFERSGQRYFSCSAYRSRQLCPFAMSEEKWTKLSTSKASPTSSETEEKPKASEKPAKKVNDPLSNPNQRDKGEAQYHFNDKTAKFFLDQFQNLEVDSVLCIGTPSLHQQIRDGDGELKSFLLDIDNRFAQLYKDEFAQYNMCNHHFFKDSENYREFLANSKKIAVVVDPPFGVKVELIWHGCINGVKKDFGQINGDAMSIDGENSNLEVFWIFPYFMEGHILSKCPEAGLKMSDFHVEYSNHSKYCAGTKSKASPIRIFTTIPLSNVPLPEEDYRYCDDCTKWVDNKNLHCEMCESCTTKDGGGTYIHCFKCQKCVKPTWTHCLKCKVCHLNDNSCRREQNSSRSVQPKHFNSKKGQGHHVKSSKLKQMNRASVNIKKNTNVNPQMRQRMNKNR